jgi:hypothetical protein
VAERELNDATGKKWDGMVKIMDVETDRVQERSQYPECGEEPRCHAYCFKMC